MKDSKKKTKIVRRRHWVLLIIIRILFAPWFFLYFLFRPRYFKLKKRGPLIVLVNHVTEFDILLTDILFDFPLYFVASEQLLNKGFSSWLLNYVFAPIPKSKSMSDLSVVVRIRRVLDEGGNVCIFPEGSMTMNGNVSPLPPSIGKLIKMMKVPVAFMESYGLYFSSPRWARFRKFGPSGMKLKRLLEPYEYESMSGEAITSLVQRELAINAYEQRPVRAYRGLAKAAGLHRLVFVCPSCHQPFGMHSRGSKLYCSHCGYEGKYDVHGYLNDKTGRHDTVTLDANTKKDYAIYLANHLNDIKLEARVEIRYSKSGERRRSRKYLVDLSITNTGMTIKSRKEVTDYSFEDILSFAIQTRRKFIVYVRGNLSIVAKLPKEASHYQFLITMQLLHHHANFMKGSVDYDLLAHPDDVATLGL